ncbi:MAG: DsrE/DsrF/DrsH-like family protein [Anaerosomatales bacterium]|nr:DsrE/DsrF/DrsH-like family protein [Anaerosomatales bacterium]MDT8434606.1 DsrE/DsrF/DrsH-like family protein [Anaerosomatales bacterium]
MSDQETKKKLSMVVMSGDMDKLFGAFIIANGAAAMGQDVTMFFTFWGLRALKKDVSTGTTLFGKMLGVMYGGDISKSNPSRFSFLGMGRWMFKKMMGNHNVSSLVELRDLAVTLGVKLYPCQMSMDVMEIPAETFIDGVQDPVGVGFFIGEADESGTTLFI